MRKLVTKAIAAGMLMAVFSAYGDTSNLVFYSDFENGDDAGPIVTSGDLNGGTVAPPSLYDQIPQNGWAIGTLGKNTASQFRTGASSVIAFLAIKVGGGATANLGAPVSFKGTSAAYFSYDFKPNNGTKGVSQTITGRDSKNGIIFTIKMGGLLSSPQFDVKVNDVSLGLASRSTSATPLNSIRLTVDSTGVHATLISGATLAAGPTVNVPVLGGTDFASFALTVDGASGFDYDNFQVWAVSKAPPPPRLDLYILTPPGF